jgi:hypothetical protein
MNNRGGQGTLKFQSDPLLPPAIGSAARKRRTPMPTLHVAVCFIALLAGALVLIALCDGRGQPTWDAVLILSTALISLTGFPLASPPGTPTPDPAADFGRHAAGDRMIAALALYVGHLASAWRGIYIVAIVLAVYFNVFVAVTQAFLKIGFLHALAPTGKEPPFLIAQLVKLALLVVIGVTAFKRYRGPTVNGMISRAASGA